MLDPLRHKGEVTRHNQKMLHRAMLKRDKYDYSLSDWEQASFKHRRILDEYFETWITTDPNHNNVTDVDLRSPLTRRAIGQQKDPWRKVMIYERDRDWKYVIHPYRQIGIPNLSFWNQHITKSKLIYGLPALYDQIIPNQDDVNHLASVIRGTLAMFNDNNKSNVKNARAERIRRQLIVKTIWEEARILASLSSIDSETDIHPEVLYFWMRGYASTEPGEWEEKYEDSEPAKYQSVCTPIEQIRITRPLAPFRQRSDQFCVECKSSIDYAHVDENNELVSTKFTHEMLELPWFDYAPESVRIFKQHWRNYIKPGYFLNAGDTFSNYDLAHRAKGIKKIKAGIESSAKYPHTQINVMPAEFDRSWYSDSDIEHGDIEREVREAIKSHCLISGFSWTAGLAHYNGYWQDEDITEPITTQLINFDGENFTFSGYQLNTIAIDPENDYWNKSVNLCYVDRTLSSDDVDEIAKRLLKFAMNDPALQFDRDSIIEGEEEYSCQVQSQIFTDIAEQIPVENMSNVPVVLEDLTEMRDTVK